jgi:hypothetical protein
MARSSDYSAQRFGVFQVGQVQNGSGLFPPGVVMRLSLHVGSLQWLPTHDLPAIEYGAELRRPLTARNAPADLGERMGKKESPTIRNATLSMNSCLYANN